MPPQPPPPDPPEPLKPIPRWTAVVAVAIILAAIFTSYLILSAPIPQGTADQSVTTQLELARLRAEARRNALATGAGFVAIGALLLALRRQNHAERQQRVHEVATATAEDDALQRRITDARIRAVEQLGSSSPSVRIGGLHNLERIGEQHEHLRQIVLDEICSYLRLPFKPQPASETRLPATQFEPIGPTPAEPEHDDAEREVRLIAKEILQRHLNPELGEDRYWAHTRLNLRNAHLDSIDFSGCHLAFADFTDAIFSGDAHFYDAAFDGPAVFSGAIFREGTSFGGAAFAEGAIFRQAVFGGFAYFGDVRFFGDTNFASAYFHGAAYFERTNFDNVTFADAAFDRYAYFKRSTFYGNAGFVQASFGDVTIFTDAIFKVDLSISGATFKGYTDFVGVAFRRASDITDELTQLVMNFPPARFHKNFAGESIDLIGLIENQSVLLKEGVNHRLPEGWRLERSPINSGWGRLTNLPEGHAPME